MICLLLVLVISVKHDGIIILGCPLGNDHFTTSTCLSIAAAGEELCSKLTSLDDLQCSFLLLKHCHVTRVNHLARTVPPSLFSSTAGIHDMLTHQNFCAITGLDSLSDSHWQQAILPVKYGGLGLRSAAEISNAAYINGWAQVNFCFTCKISLLSSIY